MTKLPLTAEASARIADRIAAFPTETPDTLRWLAPYVAQHGALPMYPGWTETIGIRTDGEVVSWSTEGDYIGTRPVVDQSTALAALVQGAGRYPELRPLLPDRGPDAVECPCRANPIFASGNIICSKCCGLGWLPGADRLTSRCSGPRPPRWLSWYHRLFGGRGR